MGSTYYLLDTFTKEKFKGNPTPICLLEEVLSIKSMHAFAKEFNAPVTAFVEPKNENKIYPIRYFTVTGEIPACGHATLGAAFVLHNQTVGTQITFETIEKIMRDSCNFKKYRTPACKECPVKHLSTGRAQGGRELDRSEFADAVEENNKRYHENTSLYRKRQELERSGTHEDK
jgi:hypothetical protein